MAGFHGPPPPERFNLARYCLQGSARRAPDKTALIVADQSDGAAPSWNYREIEDRVLRLAAALGALGHETGSRLLIRLDNSPDYVFAFLGAIAAGLVPIPAFSQLTRREIGFIIDDATPCAIICGDDAKLPAAANSVPTISATELGRLIADTGRADYADTGRDDPAFLVYTSGTSGRSKGVLHAQRAAWGRRPMYQGWYGLGADDIVLHTGAFNWTYTLGVGLMDPWANGATALLYTGPRDITVWPRLIDGHSATIFAAVPTLYRQLLKYCDMSILRGGSLRHCLVAGEAVAVKLTDQWRQATGIAIYEALGMSEISTYVSSSPSVPVKPGSPGRPQAGRDVAILPVNGGDTPLGPDQEGLIAVHRSDPGLMLGYWNPTPEDAAVYRGDWFCGGDLGMLDDDGYLWFGGRADDLMNALGYRVSPQEVETALADLPGISDIAVSEIKVADQVSVIAAFIVCQDEAALTFNAIDRSAHERLAAYKCPRAYFRIDALPRTANGKLDRKALHPGRGREIT